MTVKEFRPLVQRRAMGPIAKPRKARGRVGFGRGSHTRITRLVEETGGDRWEKVFGKDALPGWDRWIVLGTYYGIGSRTYLSK